MTTAYMIAEAYQHRTPVQDSSNWAGREWTYQDIPARIIKVTNVKYVRQAHARRNEWMVYFDISEDDRREGQTGSTTRMEPVVNGVGPRFFANHQAASKALILDAKTEANRVARQAQVRVINNRRNDAIEEARGVYEEAVRQARFAYNATSSDLRATAERERQDIPEAHDTGNMKAEVQAAHNIVAARVKRFRSNKPSSRRWNSYSWNEEENFRSASSTEAMNVEVSSMAHKPSSPQAFTSVLALPTILED